MEYLVSLGSVLAFVSFCHTSAQQSVGTAVVDNGRVEIGLITGGSFGPGSFSIGGAPGGRPQPSVYVNKDNVDDQNIIIQTHHKRQEENYQPPQSEGGNTQPYPVKPPTKHANSRQRGNGGEVGSGSGQKSIGAAVLNKNKHNKFSRRQNRNKQPELDAATLEAIFGSKGGTNDFSSKENGYSNTSEQGSIQIDSITGGRFEKGTYSIDSNKKPATHVLQTGNAGYPYEGNEAQYSKKHRANHNFVGRTRIGFSHGQTKSGYNSGNSEEPWIWDR